MYEQIHGNGHENVTATHTSTFEVTTDDYLTPAGDCILGIEADRAPSDFDPAFVTACQETGARMTALIRVGDREVTVSGRGHPDLSFGSDRGAVVRTAEYIDDRTVMIGADAAAADLDRGLVDALADGAGVALELRVES